MGTHGLINSFQTNVTFYLYLLKRCENDYEYDMICDMNKVLETINDRIVNLFAPNAGLLQLSVKVLPAFFLKIVYFPAIFQYINYFPAQKHRKHIKFQQNKC